MLIICPGCSATYRIELSTLGQSGRNVRCARCKTVWLASALDAVSADFQPAPVSASTPDTPAPAPTPFDGSGGEDTGAIPPGQVAPSQDRALAPANATTAEAPSIVPSIEQDQSPLAHDTDVSMTGADVETEAARREWRARILRRPARKNRQWPISPLTTALLIMLALVGLLLNFRHVIVRQVPQTASLYARIGLPVNLRGLVFENVRLSRESHDGITVIGIEGLIVNTMNRPANVPRLRFSVRNAMGREKYAWTALPTHAALPPGEALPFASRLASPPADSKEILVRFFNRRDAIGGLPSGQESMDAPGKFRGAH